MQVLALEGRENHARALALSLAQPSGPSGMTVVTPGAAAGLPGQSGLLGVSFLLPVLCPSCQEKRPTSSFRSVPTSWAPEQRQPVGHHEL